MWHLAKQGEVQGIFFWAALYAFFALFYSLVRQIQITSWPSTKGQLLKKSIENFGVGEWAKSDQDYVTSAQYRYVVNGKEYEGHRVSPWVIVSSHNMRSVLKRQLNSVQLSSDGKVTVYYKPLRPEKSFLIKPGIKGQIFTAFLATIPFALYWVRYHG